MRKPAAAATSLAWFLAIGGTFGCLLPYLLDYWHFHQPLPQWWIAQAVGSLLICAGMIPLAVRSSSSSRRAERPSPSPRRRAWW